METMEKFPLLAMENIAKASPFSLAMGRCFLYHWLALVYGDRGETV
jgi:hypothetical protein